ncbi:MAG: dTDP-4-dehydrorhamnose 3,5-epimerase, partial [Bacteroidota bacterium]|nr:dTDP-4-dehydrorhamnose 3,5-epimerase [Bacteroidota bacterium]
MKILEVKSMPIPDVKVIKYGRYSDSRGYFCETVRRSLIDNHPDAEFFKELDFRQFNESYSEPGVMRGLHFQWNPNMGKLLRTLVGEMFDIFLDIRKGSPTFGKASIYKMPYDSGANWGEWIWVPPGFAHGNFFKMNTLIEYFCTSEYSPGCEASISPLSPDIDWSLCPPELKAEFDSIV